MFISLFSYDICLFEGFPGAQMVKNLPAVWETWVQSLGWEDPLDEGMEALLHYSCLENPHGQRSLVDYRPWGHKESGVTKTIHI